MEKTYEESMKEIDDLNEEYFNELNKHYNEECLICRHIQGQPKHGVANFFCNHLTNKIEKLQKNRIEKLQTNILLNMTTRGIISQVHTWESNINIAIHNHFKKYEFLTREEYKLLCDKVLKNNDRIK